MYVWLFQLFLERRKALIQIKNAGLEDLLFSQIASQNTFFFDYMTMSRKRAHEGAVNLRYEIFIHYQMGGITRVIMEWIKNDMKTSPEDMGTIIHDITNLFEGEEGYIPKLLNDMNQ